MPWAGWLWVAWVGLELAPAEPAAGVPVADDVNEAPAGPTALDHLALAQRHRDVGDLAGALASANAAVLADPRLAFAYLARAQIRIDLAGDAPDPAADPDAARAWSDAFDAAADDLDRYLELEQLEAATRIDIEHQREALRAAATAQRERMVARPSPEPLPVIEPSPPPPADLAPAPPPTGRRRGGGIALVLTGSALASVGIGAFAAGVRIEQRCVELCSARWSVRPAALAVGAVGTAAGTVLAALGARALVHGGSRVDPRRARGIGVAALGLGGGAAVAGATVLSLARGRWGRATPSDDAWLAGTQARANAGLALLAAVPPLVTAAVVVLVRARVRGRQGVARR